MKRAIKPDVAPGEFKCRTCEVMWSSFMENNSPCTDTTLVRNGLHDFDFGNFSSPCRISSTNLIG